MHGGERTCRSGGTFDAPCNLCSSDCLSACHKVFGRPVKIERLRAAGVSMSEIAERVRRGITKYPLVWFY